MEPDRVRPPTTSYGNRGPYGDLARQSGPYGRGGPYAHARPGGLLPHPSGVGYLPPELTPEVNQQLDAWVEAKREKQFERADVIRDELRAIGIEPDAVRPASRYAGHG